MTAPRLTDDLCEFVLDLRWDDLAAAQQATVHTTGNALCLMIGAANHPAVARTVNALRGMGGNDEIPLLGRADSLPAVWATLVHGVAGHVEDFDDTHPPSIIHPGPPVVASALSAAVRTNASGIDVLTAVAAGVEVALRTGLALMPAALDRGWHMTGIAGPIGAAMAAGRLLGLQPPALRHAVGLAATQSAGVIEALGSMAKPLQPGKAGANGYEAALLAANGLDGPAEPIAGRRGLLALHAGSTDGAAVVQDELGSRWEIERNEIKPYACGVVSHAIIDVASAAGAADRTALPQRVTLTVNPFVLVAMGHTDPRNSLEAKFSAVHSFAVGYRYGLADPAQFDDDAVTAPEIAALRQRCLLVPDESLPLYAVEAEIVATDGTVYHQRRDHPDRLDEAGIHRKARAMTEPVLGAQADDFVARVFDLASHSVTDIMELARPARAGMRGDIG